MTGAPDDGYDGPARIRSGADVIEVEVSLRGHFDPISGSYRWYGRVAAGPALTALMERAPGRVRLETPDGEAETGLSDIDPWGRPRVEGNGAPPFAVLTDLPPDGAEPG